MKVLGRMRQFYPPYSSTMWKIMGHLNEQPDGSYRENQFDILDNLHAINSMPIRMQIQNETINN